jgi:hypothetical protein
LPGCPVGANELAFGGAFLAPASAAYRIGEAAASVMKMASARALMTVPQIGSVYVLRAL